MEANRVQRDGATVRRQAGPWSASVQALLAHVRARGIDWVPEPLGVVDGVDVVSFVEGDVPDYPLPAWVWEERVLAAAARALRELHDATAGFARAGQMWQLAAHEPAEVICHNDFAPYNLVFRDGELAGAIDFEAASPGPRVWDLAYLAYRLVPLTAPANPDGRTDTDRPARLAQLCAAYGELTPAEVLAVVPDRLDELADFSDDHARPADARLYREDAAHLRG